MHVAKRYCGAQHLACVIHVKPQSATHQGHRDFRFQNSCTYQCPCQVFLSYEMNIHFGSQHRTTVHQSHKPQQAADRNYLPQATLHVWRCSTWCCACCWLGHSHSGRLLLGRLIVTPVAAPGPLAFSSWALATPRAMAHAAGPPRATHSGSESASTRGLSLQTGGQRTPGEGAGSCSGAGRRQSFIHGTTTHSRTLPMAWQQYG
jgi:hypothetical protein